MSKKALIIYRIDRDDTTTYGVFNKMLQQQQAISSYGYETDICYLRNDGIYLNDTCIKQFTRNSKIYRWINLLYFFYFVSKRISGNYDLYYIRYAPLSLALCSSFSKLKSNTSKVYLELATYPYLGEYKGITKWLLRIFSFRERFFRKYIDRLLHLGIEDSIWNIDVIHFENGIKVEDYQVANIIWKQGELHLISVGSLYNSQGLERLIKGMASYRAKEDAINVYLTIVGDGKKKIELERLTKELELTDKVIFKGAYFGKNTDQFYNDSDIAIGKLDLYSIGFHFSKALKHREYCARAIPFIYAGTDTFFEEKAYTMQVQNDESEIDIASVVAFKEKLMCQNNVQQIMRSDALNNFNWEKQYEFLNSN